MSITPINQEDFFKEFPTAAKKFPEANIEWNVLELIYNDYVSIQDELNTGATYSFNLLITIPKVHSVRFRVKDPKHLIEKIIRKKYDSNDLDVTVDNYKTIFHDLIGLRAMHLFKMDWEDIHDGILSKWDIHGKPIVNFRDGDSDEIKANYKNKGCELKQHPFGYRSIHYIVKVPIGKRIYYAEIQTRTIYEEAWSEIDHTVRYPYFVSDPIINAFTSISNRLSGTADEMGTFIKRLSDFQNENMQRFAEYEQSIKNLENTIQELSIDQESKNKINEEINEIVTKSPQTFTVAYGNELSRVAAISGLSSAVTMLKEQQNYLDLSGVQSATNLLRESHLQSNLTQVKAAVEALHGNNPLHQITAHSAVQAIRDNNLYSQVSGLHETTRVAREMKDTVSSITQTVDTIKRVKKIKQDKPDGTNKKTNVTSSKRSKK